MKKITVHVISALVVDYCLQGLFVYCRQLRGVDHCKLYTVMTIYFVLYAEA